MPSVGGGRLRKARNINTGAAGQRSTTVRSQHRRRQPPRCCAECGVTGVRLYQDHVVNLAAGGTDTVANLQWLCGPHHDAKSERERIAGLQRYHAKRYRDVEPHPGML
jgi:hypothetical protein